MSVCAPAEEDSAADETANPARAVYEQKAESTVVRVLTVLAYLLSVSLAAILLSVYYIWVWKSPVILDDIKTVAGTSAFRDESPLYNYTGRGNTTVNETASQLVPASFNNTFETTQEIPNATVSMLDLSEFPDQIAQELFNATSDDIGDYRETNSIT